MDQTVRRMGRQILVLAVILLLLCLFLRLFRHNEFVSYIEMDSGKNRNLELDFTDDSFFEDSSLKAHDGYLEVHLDPDESGTTLMEVRDKSGKKLDSRLLWVGPLKTVFDRSSGGFTGDTLILIAVTVFSFAVSIIMLYYFDEARGTDIYSYLTIYTAGFSILSFTSGIMLLLVTFRHASDPASFPMNSVYYIISRTSYSFMLYTLPFVIIFAILMCVSNIALLLHERFRFRNILGIIISLSLIAGELLAIWLFRLDYTGPMLKVTILRTLRSVYATVYVYFECILAGSVICGIMAVKHKVKHDKDYCVILGCGFRKDGSLTPLLKGRVDRAIEFAREQEAESGKLLTFVPSGGQGKGEIMAEAEAMGRYLVLSGIPEDRIIRENKSRNTYENMAFSKKLIEKESDKAQVIFSTTNYHIFRSGVWARLAGLQAEGIGSRTKWWFWPNAFVRECVGLAQNRWKQELTGLLFVIGFYAGLSIMLAI